MPAVGDTKMLQTIATMMASAALTIVLALPSAVPVRAADSATAAMPEPIERASADDCAIFVELGKKQLHWGATPPTASFYPEWPGAGGAGTYLEECPWKQLGVAAPLSPAQNPNESFFITRPVYAGPKSTAATVKFEYRHAGKSADGQQNLRPFFVRQTCSFEKDEQGWLLMGCKTDIIS
jgi:hypothetical protein